MHTEPYRLPLVVRVLTARSLLFGAAAVIWLVLYLNDWDALARLSVLDKLHEGWGIDETITALFAMGFAWMILVIRRTYELRHEVARRRDAESAADQLARHDPLTGLPNRRVFQETTAHIIAGLPLGGTVAALLVDLDGFKTTNDVHGHAGGDDVLCQVADRLTELVAGNGTVARLGGDEFVVVAKANLDKDALARIADRIVLALA